MDELSKRLLTALLAGDVAAGLALLDRLHDAGDHVRAVELGRLIGQLADRVEAAWDDVPDGVDDAADPDDAAAANLAWDPAAQAVMNWDQFATDVRQLFWVVAADAAEKSRLADLLAVSQKLVAREYATFAGDITDGIGG